VPGWPATMRRDLIRYEPSSAVSPCLSYQDLEPIAVPPTNVARRLSITVEQVLAEVAPCAAADGRRLWSVHQVTVALGLRLSRIERARKRQDRAS
jgi:hypothetical protein